MQIECGIGAVYMRVAATIRWRRDALSCRPLPSRIDRPSRPMMPTTFRRVTLVVTLVLLVLAAALAGTIAADWPTNSTGCTR